MPQPKLLMVAVFSAAVLYAAPNLSRVPLSFEPGLRNSGFVGRSGERSVLLTQTGADAGQGRMRLIGARPTASAEPEELLPGYSNYLTDPDPGKWRTHVPNYRRVRYHNIYPGI